MGHQVPGLQSYESNLCRLKREVESVLVYPGLCIPLGPLWIWDSDLIRNMKLGVSFHRGLEPESRPCSSTSQVSSSSTRYRRVVWSNTRYRHKVGCILVYGRLLIQDYNFFSFWGLGSLV